RGSVIVARCCGSRGSNRNQLSDYEDAKREKQRSTCPKGRTRVSNHCEGMVGLLAPEFNPECKAATPPESASRVSAPTYDGRSRTEGELLEFLGRDVAQGAVMSQGSAIQTPGFRGFARLTHAEEPGSLEARGVLIRPAGAG